MLLFNTRILLFLIPLFLSVSCALHDQYIVIEPKISTSGKIKNSNESEISLTVTSSLESNKIGVITNLSETFYIYLPKNLTEILENEIKTLLIANNYKIKQSNSKVKMDIVIKSLSINSEKLPIKYKTNLEVQAIVIIQNFNETYERTIKISSDKETAGPPLQKITSSLLNESLSSLLTDIFSNEKVWEILSK